MSPIAVPDTFNPVQTTMNLLKPSGLAGVDTTNTANTASSRSIRALDSNWSFHQLPSSLSDSKDVREPEWIKVQSMPTSVHVQLLKQGKIVDPYKGLGEWDVQWVGEADWQFKTTFTVSAEEMAKDHVDLVLDGLDTFCDVELDGKLILQSDNMFVSHRVPIKPHLGITSSTHTLTLTFTSAWLKAKQIELSQLSLAKSAHEAGLPLQGRGDGSQLKCWNGNSSRLYVRKAQYGWGWDWGPVLVTAGPWKPIWVQSYQCRVEGLRVGVEMEEPWTRPKLKAGFEVVHGSEGIKAKIGLIAAGGEVVRSQEVEVRGGEGQVEWTFEDGDVELWWPHGHGKQPLYTVKVELITESGRTLHTTTTRIGFRTAKVVQEPLIDAPGMSFLFEINGRRIFCGGSNWIPADSFLTEVDEDRYRRWLRLMVEGNQNMVRVWAGGVYEADVFYDICDELGLLVWQDFMFGCGQYPAHDDLVANVKVEAEQAVKRLRNHPSVVLFAGNNEDYQIAESERLELDYSDHTSDYRETTFPARHIYERVLPDIVGKHSDVFYHPGSPFGGVDSRDPTVGDIHQWNVWHGTQEPWANWDKLGGRFISEFGMEGYPDIRTVDYWLDGDVSQRFPQSRVVCSHNKADGFERRLELYLMENFRHAFDMESYVYYTQAMQAETLAAAYRLWRRDWRGRGKEYTAGALVWQINDCWPTTSWAIVDYFLRPKPAYYAIARELRPFTVGMARKDVKLLDNPLSAANFKVEQRLEIWGNNSAFDEKKAKLEVVAYDLHGGEVSRTETEVVLAPNSSTEFWKGLVPGQLVRTSDAQVPLTIVVGARLIDLDGTVLARYGEYKSTPSNWPEPWKYITFPDPELKISVSGENVTLTCSKPIKGVVLDVDGDEVKWSDQALDLMPGDPQTIVAKGLNGRNIKARYIGDGSA